MAGPDIEVVGLRHFSKQLRTMDAELPKQLRIANNAVAQIVVDGARPKVPTRKGRARKSIKAKSTRTAVRVSAGGKRVPYYGWLDFGGSTGIKRRVRRPFFEEGRFIYPSYSENRDEVYRAMENALAVVARQAGLELELLWPVRQSRSHSPGTRSQR